MLRIGTGWDIHLLVPGRPLVLGGVTIPHDLGEAGHSDGDVLVHAVIDALLGAAALGDIGTFFPSSEARWKDISSMELLERTLHELHGFTIGNIDCTVILEKPRLAPHIATIRISLAEACSLPYDRISVKAKTADGLLGEVGQGKAVIAQAVVLLSHAIGDSEGMADDWV